MCAAEEERQEEILFLSHVVYPGNGLKRKNNKSFQHTGQIKLQRTYVHAPLLGLEPRWLSVNVEAWGPQKIGPEMYHMRKHIAYADGRNQFVGNQNPAVEFPPTLPSVTSVKPDLRYRPKVMSICSFIILA